MPRLSGRPLYDVRRDAELFVDRADQLARLGTAGREGLNVLLVGEPGSGKTSLLRRFLLERRTNGEPAAFVDGSAAETPGDLLGRVVARIAPGVDPAGNPADLVARLADAELGDGWAVLIDGPPQAAAHPVFGQLRDELWSLPLTWVVAVPDRDEAAFLRPPADAFFDVRLRLPALGEADVRELLRRRIGSDELDDATLGEIAAVAGGRPRRAVELARLVLVEQVPVATVRSELLLRRAALSRLSRPAAMLLDELETSGPASASDERLLTRLGWTRSRAAQVLGELEEAGLVVATDERDGPGRPRKVYRPTGKMSG